MNDFSDNKIENIPLNLCKHCGKCKLGRPMSIWDKMPDGCGFEGWLFVAREAVKQKIRVQKEELLLLKIDAKTVKGEHLAKILKRISEIEKEIEKYFDYGSENW